MHLPGQDQLPAKVANVSRDELRKYGQCKRVGNYLLSKTVGEGSFAKVKEAFHILTGEKVAIKIIDKNRARKDRYVSKNMRREARLLQMIRHPHIVQLLEIVETSQCYYLVFEFADGGDLMDYICKRRKLEEDEVRKFIRQIISAVEYLHRLGIIHRDLKVENLLLDANKNIKIIDFGLSNTIYSPDPTNENHCSTQCGSPAYAAPELLVRKDYGPQIDVWSIGVNLYAMLTGRLPYTVEPFNISTLYNKMLRKQMNVIPEYLSEGCKDFIQQLLNPNPRERLNILEAAQHRWITDDRRDPLFLTICPNYLCEEDLEDHILDHVEGHLKLNSDDVIRDIIQNRATKNSCVYHLMVRRLERYKREYQDLITMPPSVEDKVRVSPQCSQTLTIGKVPSQQNGVVQDQRPPAKTHIIENPFKTIKVALIRQKKASKTGEKSKSVTIKKPPTSSQVSNSSPRVESTNKPKLCSVRRVALVKVSPARRSFRGLTSSSRSLANSPKPSRRFFEGLQNRRKSPRVRRRHAEPDDSTTSVGSTSRQRNSFYGKKTTRNVVRRSSASKQSPGDRNSKNTENLEMACAEEYPGEKSMEEIVAMETAQAEEKPLEAVTHFYADKGVVLKRDSTGNDEIETDLATEKDVIQHVVFHSNGKETVENVRDIQEPGGHDRVSVEVIKEGFTEDGKPNIQVVNAKISSISTRRGAERLEPISPRSPNCSGTPTSQRTPDKTSPQSDPLPSRKLEEEPRSPNGVSTTPSPAPTSSSLNTVPPQKDPSALRKSDEKLPTPNRVSRNSSDVSTPQNISNKGQPKKDSSSSKEKLTIPTEASKNPSSGKLASQNISNKGQPKKDASSTRKSEGEPTSQHTPSKGKKDPCLPRKPQEKPGISKPTSLNSSNKLASQHTPNKDQPQRQKDPSSSGKPEEKLSTPVRDRSSTKKPEEKPGINKPSSLTSSEKPASQYRPNKDQPRKDPSLPRTPEEKSAITKPASVNSSNESTSQHTPNKNQPQKARSSLRNRVSSNFLQPTSGFKVPAPQKDPSLPPKHEAELATSNRRSSLNQSKIPIPAGKSSSGPQSPVSSTWLASRTLSVSSASTRPSRTASRTKVSTLADKYTKCFSVVAVNEPSATNGLGPGTRKSSVNESSLKTEKIGRLEEKNGEEPQPDAKANTRLQRISNGVTGNNTSERRRLSNDSSERKNSRMNGPTSTSKEEKKGDENSKKNINAIANGQLPNVGESQAEAVNAKEPIRQTQPWARDERRKISNYRKTSDAKQMNATLRREIRTASTNCRSPSTTSRPSS